MTRSIHRDSGDKRPIARDLHPLEVGNYRVGTPAIETQIVARLMIEELRFHGLSSAS